MAIILFYSVCLTVYCNSCNSETFHYRGEEAQVIDYQTQQEKLFPLMAAAFGFLFTGNFMQMEYNRISADIEKGRMDEMQSVSSESG